MRLEHPQPPQVVETSCPIKGVMCTRKGMHKECNKSVVTQLTRAHMGYIGSVVPLPSRPAALGPKSLLSLYPMWHSCMCHNYNLKLILVN